MKRFGSSVPPFSVEDGKAYMAIFAIAKEDGDLSKNLEAFLSEGFRALKVLSSIPETQWLDIHKLIQSGEVKYEPCISEFWHASNVILAIEANDEVGMLRSLIKMIDAVNEEIKFNNESAILENKALTLEAREIIRRSAHATKKGFQSIKATKMGLETMQSENPPVDADEAKRIQDACYTYGSLNPSKSLTYIRKHVAQHHKPKRSWSTIRDHTPQLKGFIKTLKK